MKRSIIIIAIILGVGINNCKNENNPNPQTEKPNKSLISIVEIPTTNFLRAVTFYQTVLGVKIEEVDMEGTQMGIFPSSGDTVSVVLVNGNDYTPTKNGTVVYLNAGNDLQPTLNEVEKNGGKIILPKTKISPEMGFFALFIDTEGNKLGLHSKN